GQHGSVPAGKGLQAAESCDALGAWPQHQVIGIAEHDIGPGIAHLAPMQALHRAAGTNGDESRRSYRAMWRRQAADARLSVTAEQFKMIGRGHQVDLSRNSRQASP